MLLVWFIYGLAFFVLGLVVLVYPRRNSRFTLARHLWMIGIFGIVHGVNEWLDMFIHIGGPLPPTIMADARMATLAGSFYFLLQFGVTIVRESTKPHRPSRAVPLLLAGGWLVILLLGEPGQRCLAGDIWARYLLCLPGASLTALGLFLQRRDFRAMGLHAICRYLTVAACTFLIYGVLAGVVVKRASFFPASLLNYETFAAATGLPVQVLRTLCAAVAAGSLIRMLDVFRWESHEALRVSELRCASIASAIPVFLFMIDRGMCVTFLQGKGLDTLGLCPGQAHGRPISDVFDSSESFLENCRRALEGQEFMAVDSLNGTPFEIYYSALRDSADAVTSGVGVALDVSSQIKAQRELDELRYQMEGRAREAAVGALSTMMGHQVAEPLSVAQLMLERVLAETAESDLSDAVRTAVRKGLSEVSKADETLRRFLRIVHGGLPAREQPIGLYQIARRTVSVFADRARHKQLAIAIKDMDCVPLMTVSAREMEQIFYHLIQRALDAAGGDVQQKLSIGCSAFDGRIELTFRQACGGNGPEVAEHVLDPMPHDTEGMGGGGLGLAIVHQIVVEHGGEITDETRADGTMILRIRLPIGRVY